MKQLKTRRLLLEPMHEDALLQLMEAEPDAHMRQAYGEMLEGLRAHPTDWVFFTEWSILLRRSGERIGGLGFKGPATDGAVDIGYGLDAPHRGHGYAREAVSAAIDWAFAQPGVFFVTAEAEEGNLPSRRLLEKLGFTPFGTGAEGILYEKARPAAYWSPLLAGIGLCIGALVGLLCGNLLIGLCTGLCAGLLPGLLLDLRQKNALDDCRRRRAAAAAARRTD